MRYRSEDEWRAAVEQRAREMWDEREASSGLGPTYRQTWEQGTALARGIILERARQELSA